MFAKMILGFVSNALDGKKTTIGGVGMILVGIAGIIAHMWPDLGLPQMDIDRALESIAMGFGVLGIGGKIQKSGAPCKG